MIGRPRSEAEAERQKQHALFMQAPVAIAIIEGRQLLFTFANPAYRALVNGRDVVGKTLLEALPDLKGQGFDVLLNRVLDTGEPFFGKEVPIKLEHHVGDELLRLNFVYTAKRNLAGEVDGILVSAFDVTELVGARQQAEALTEKVRASEDQMRLVIDAIPLLVSFVTADERYGLVNTAYENWFGFSQEVLLGRTIREVIGEAAYGVLGPYVRRGLAGERLSFEQYGVLSRRGGTRDVGVSLVPRQDAAGTVEGYVAVLEDITDQRRAEQERERLFVLAQLIQFENNWSLH